MKYQKVYQLVENPFGYVLKNEDEKFVLNRTKKENSNTPFYLKQVKPNDQYISGMYYDKRNNKYNGKDYHDRHVIVDIHNSTATITYLS